MDQVDQLISLSPILTNILNDFNNKDEIIEQIRNEITPEIITDILSQTITQDNWQTIWQFTHKYNLSTKTQIKLKIIPFVTLPIEDSVCMRDLRCGTCIGKRKSCSDAGTAASRGHMFCLMKQHDSFNSNVCFKAASKGHLECLKYAHENGCPWNEVTTANAVYMHHLECLKYASDNKCPGYEKYIHLTNDSQN